MKTSFHSSLLRKICNYGIRQSFSFGLFELKRFFYYRLILKSYSLDREDIIIDRLCGFKKRGFYVDVGACNPSRLSNTKRFYDRGWTGINIDANPGFLENFIKARTKDINVSCGVGIGEGIHDFYVMFPSTTSTFSRQFKGNGITKGFEYIETKKIPVKKLGTILEEYLPVGTTIDFLSIDVEGRDFDVLMSNNWKKFSPMVICIECPTLYHGVPGKNLQLSEYLNSYGYDLAYHNGMDAFYVKAETTTDAIESGQ